MKETIQAPSQPDNTNEETNENQDFADFMLAAKKIYLTDLLKFPKNKTQIPLKAELNPEYLSILNEKNFNKTIENTSLKNLLAKNESEIEEAYYEISDLLSKGIKPTVTLDLNFLNSLIKNGLKKIYKNDTYDKQKLIAATIGRQPLLADQRIVCEIDGVSINDLTPRSTNHEVNFKFNGVVLINKDIEPENIIIVSVPSDLAADFPSLPIKASLLKEKRLPHSETA